MHARKSPLALLQGKRTLCWCLDGVGGKNMEGSERWQDRGWQVLDISGNLGRHLLVACVLLLWMLYVEAPQTARSLSQKTQ
jgi:hypothetical protein